MKKFVILLGLFLIAGCSEPKALGPRIPATADEAKALQSATAERLGVAVEKKVEIADGISMDFVLIPAGQFHMGSPPSEWWRDSDEGPLHQVEISKSFYMGKYEVTQQQYEAVLGPSRKIKFRGPDLPVENVEWSQCQMFCGAVSNKAGLKVRLPTEAEWEYACRAGTDTAFNTGPTVNASQANYDCTQSYNGGRTGPPVDRTSKVGSYQPNAFGLYDMHGNVCEWCQDIYKKDFYKNSPGADPANDGRRGRRVIRGGSYIHPPVMVRSAERNRRIQGADRRYLGFRVLLEIEEAPAKTVD
jgi:formylglycine-generating enzyme required for sulfatase activity